MIVRASVWLHVISVLN